MRKLVFAVLMLPALAHKRQSVCLPLGEGAYFYVEDSCARSV